MASPGVRKEGALAFCTRDIYGECRAGGRGAQGGVLVLSLLND